MLNNQDGNTIATECARLNRDITQRGVRRFLARLFQTRQNIEVVFDLRAGVSPKKSVFERMATHAGARMLRALEDAQHVTLLEKQRSPKYGTVVYTLSHTLTSDAPHHVLRQMVSELAEIADACRDVDTHGIELFQA